MLALSAAFIFLIFFLPATKKQTTALINGENYSVILWQLNDTCEKGSKSQKHVNNLISHKWYLCINAHTYILSIQFMYTYIM